MKLGILSNQPRLFLNSKRTCPEQNQKNKSILVMAGYAPSLLNFRGLLLRALVSAGMDVVCTAPEADLEVTDALAEMGVRYVPISVQRNKVGVLADILYWLALYRLMRRERPSMVLAYTVKPVVYGLSAARFAGVRSRHALITGLGYTFTSGVGGRQTIRIIVQRLYRAALSGAKTVFFQNPDDRDEFLHRGLVAKEQTCVVNGSGVDLSRFDTAPISTTGPIGFLLIARLLADKGIREFVEAARRVRKQAPKARFMVVGPFDSSPEAISPQEVEAWCREGIVEYCGALKDVRPAIAACTVYVLPSYREGTPRSVLEAMSMRRPIITTDAPGCRETVIDGDNGFLVPVKDVNALAEAMLHFIEQPAIVEIMAQRSREIAEEKYDVHKINDVMLRAMGIG